MQYKKSGNKKEVFFPESIPACEFVEGQFYVPPEWEDYYTRVWAWKRARKLSLEVYKLKYLEDFEDKHGKIMHWQDQYGNLRPLYLVK